jgi:hypothetical protein
VGQAASQRLVDGDVSAVDLDPDRFGLNEIGIARPADSKEHRIDSKLALVGRRSMVGGNA